MHLFVIQTQQRLLHQKKKTFSRIESSYSLSTLCSSYNDIIFFCGVIGTTMISRYYSRKWPQGECYLFIWFTVAHPSLKKKHPRYHENTSLRLFETIYVIDLQSLSFQKYYPAFLCLYIAMYQSSFFSRYTECFKNIGITLNMQDVL